MDWKKVSTIKSQFLELIKELDPIHGISNEIYIFRYMDNNKFWVKVIISEDGGRLEVLYEKEFNDAVLEGDSWEDLASQIALEIIFSRGV